MATSKIAADAVVLADDVADEVVEVAVAAKNNPILLAGVALVAASVGGFIGYKYAVKKLTPVYEQRLAEELEASKRFLKTAEFATPESAVEELLEKAKADAVKIGDRLVEDMSEFDEPVEEIKRIVRNYNKPVAEETTEAVVVQNVFAKNEVKETDPDDEGGDDIREDGPYRVSFNDFHGGDQAPGWTQLALTYYALDDTLADEDGQVIESVEATIGVDILDFIRTSKKETVFVRNPKSQIDFEVAYYMRKYSETVGG